MADQQHPKSAAPRNKRPLVSGVFEDGTILELSYRPEDKQTAFIIWRDGAWTQEKRFCPTPQICFVPYAADNNLIQHQVVLLPSAPEEYGTEDELIKDMQAYIHRYVDVSPLFEQIAIYYVLFSWVYDGFNELPYLRLRGDPGSGKTRFLLTVGALCYKPIFASGASTISPIFRMLDAFRGTLIIDESDFRMSDEKAEMVKILNNGNVKGFPVLRCEISEQKEFNPKAYTVYGPKLVATRGYFDDRALESRFLTEEMGQRRLRSDIPINLSSDYKDEARQLRNKLLLFRFRNLHKRQPLPDLVDRSLEPRLNQVFVPLMSMIDDPHTRADLHELARRYNRDMAADRGMGVEAQVLETIWLMQHAASKPDLSIKNITEFFQDRHGEAYERKMTTKWVGSIIRRRLNLKAQKRHGVFVIPDAELPKLRRLYERYGIGGEETAAPDPRPLAARVDFGDLGDIEQGYRPAA